MNRQGSLSLIIGPMGSGKTTRAIEQVSQFCALGFKTTYITSMIEAERAKLDQMFYSHNSSGASLHPLCTVARCNELPDSFGDAEVIVIDEAQFFNTLVEVVQAALKLGKNVQVYGLSSDFNGRKFGSAIDLVPFSDSITQMTAKCVRCSEEKRIIVPAPFTEKIGGTTDKQIEGGGMNKYIPVCRFHHTRLN